MSQTSSTPSHVQSRDARQHQALLEENRRLKEALKDTQDEMEFLKEALEKERAEKRTLWIENRRLRGPGHGTSGDQTSIQQWQDRAEEAERELSRIQGSLAEFKDAWRDIGQAYANVTGQNRDLNPAGQVEREAHSRTSGSDQDVVMTGDGTRPVSDRPSMRKSRGGSQNSGNPLAHEPNALSLLGSDLHHGSSLQRSSLSSRPGLKRPFEPEVGGLEGPSLRRPPPVPTHLRESPPQRPSFVETIDPSDRNAAASHVAGGEMDLTNRPEHHANTQEASPTGGESPSSTDSESSGFPTVASLIRANLVTSTAPAIPRRDTPVPRVIMGPWDLHGPVVKPATAASFMRTIRGENKPDKEQNP